MIEANDREIFKNSQAYEQKRYNRYRTFYEGKIDSKGSLETYPVNMINFFQNLSYHNNALPFKFYNEEMKNVYAYSQGNHGIVHCVKSNPLNHNTLYAGSAMGGLFRTYNALDPNSQNVKWKNVTGNYFSSGVLDIEIDPADSNKIYICTGVHLTSLAADGDYGIGLYKSTDGGNTWSHILVLQPSQMIYIYSLAMDPNNSNTMYAVSHYRIYKTTNGWQSYTEINTGLGLNSGEDILEMIINPNNSNELYAFGHSVVLHSTDAGTTWTHVTSDVVYGTGYSVSRRFTMAWNTYDGLPYCLFYQNTGDPYDHGTIRKLISGTWQTVFTNFSYTPGYCLELQISPNGNIYGGGRYTYFYNGIQQIRLNSSSNFNEIHDDVRDIIFTGNTCFLATDGGVVRGTTDAYNGFMSINGNLNNGQFEGLSFAKTDPQILFAGGIDNGSRLRDNQGTWIHKFGCDGGKTVVDWSNSNILYTDQGCGGVSLATTASIPSPGNLPYYDTPIMQHKFISGIIFVGMNNYAKVYLPATNQWYNYGPFVDYSIITSMEMCNSDSLTQCLAYTYSWGGSSLYITHSGYQGFINRTSNIDAGVTPYAKIVDVEIHNLDPNKIWVAFGNFVDGKKIYYSSNGGVNWSNISYDLPNIPINSIVYDEVNGGCFVGTDGGIYYLADGTSSWIMMNLTDNLFPCAMVNELSISRENGELVVATLGRGAWKGDIFCPYDANIPINVTSTQTWPIGKKLTSDLVIDNNSTLTIKETLKVPNAATITVKNGSTLILDENSILQGACKEYYEGSIIVEPGGNLVLKDNSLVKLAGNGNIYIEDNSTTSGTLDYYPGVSIVLHDDNTAVNISGTLNIQPNANFTFTGSGYIKFSSPNWPSNNITYGSGSSITLSGSGQSDKIMEIAQETVFMPNCTLSNGLVYMQHPNARMQAASENTSMFLDNVKFSPLGTTRTQHRGVNVWGNQNCTISNCIFENGQYGIYAYLSYGGTSLSVSNCNFTNNTYGMWVHDKSFNSSTCTFTKNDYGIYAENTSVNDSK
ncbi:MAG: right-handed parallel beta-helix repeat-containing protein, partial [Ignavibacteria bacterium]|nr:right-handed parallel beta-helix repeat-containing protein [Ignavibacteria bacterium]